MNHRDIMALAVSASGNPFQCAFMNLPLSLQDEIMDGLCTGDLTFAEAAKKIKEAGFKNVSIMTVSRYYNLYQMQRQVYDLRNIVVGLMDEYSQVDPRTCSIALYNVLVTNVLKAISDGTMRFKHTVDPSKLIETLLAAGKVLDKLTPDGAGVSTVDVVSRNQKFREAYGL